MSFSPEQKGRLYRRAADATTYARNGFGVMVAVDVASGNRLLPSYLRQGSFGGAALVGAIGMLDKADGYLARKAERYGVEILEADKSRDSDLDKKHNKVLTYGFIAASITRGVVQRESRHLMHAAALGLYMVATNNRDERMAASRAEAVEGADTGAIMENKVKTLFQNVGHTLEMSQLAPFCPELMYTTSVALGEIGLRKADVVHQTAITAEAA